MSIESIEYKNTTPFLPVDSFFSLLNKSKNKTGAKGNSFYDLINQQQGAGDQGQNALMNNDMTGGQMFMQWLGKLLSPSFIGAI